MFRFSEFTRIFATVIQWFSYSTLGPYIAKRRTLDVQKKYTEIGGGSPIFKWTNIQGEMMCQKLDIVSPQTAPHKHYVAFRYVDPLTEETLTTVENPCVLGMLWTVTSEDTDCMTVMLLNSWLPDKPADLTGFRSAGDMLAAPHEPELLRLLRFARETAHLYSNSAALVARGIPIRVVDN